MGRFSSPGLRCVAWWIVAKVAILLNDLLSAIVREGIYRGHRVTPSCVRHSRRVYDTNTVKPSDSKRTALQDPSKRNCTNLGESYSANITGESTLSKVLILTRYVLIHLPGDEMWSLNSEWHAIGPHLM